MKKLRQLNESVSMKKGWNEQTNLFIYSWHKAVEPLVAPVKLLSFHFSSSTTTIALTFIYIISPFTVHRKRKKVDMEKRILLNEKLSVCWWKKKVENQRNWVNDWIKYMMLFDLCAAFVHWTCVQWKTCYVMSALLHLKWLTKCLGARDESG